VSDGLIQIFPPFGAEGVCEDYDADCLEMEQPRRVACWIFGRCFDSEGACPFMD
jgi:hypothetical protein